MRPRLPVAVPEGDEPPGVIPLGELGDDRYFLDKGEKTVPYDHIMKRVWQVTDLIQQESADDLLRIEYEDDADAGAGIRMMRDPVLSVVIACRKTQLATRLIEKMHDPRRLENKNYVGDTALHVAAAMNDLRVAKALVRKNCNLVGLRNKMEETPLHKAALNGHRDFFLWLVKEGKSSPFSRRKDGATMLHCAIMGRALVLALHIAKEYKSLITCRDENGRTPLRLMVTVPHLFLRKRIVGSLSPDGSIHNGEERKKFKETADEESRPPASAKTVSSCSDPQDDVVVIDVKIDSQDGVGVSGLTRTLIRFKKIYAVAVVACICAVAVVAWIIGCVIKILKPFSSTLQTLDLGRVIKHIRSIELVGELAAGKYFNDYLKDESPLIDGIKVGLDDFVLKILQVCPQSVTFFDDHGKNVLQAAIIYRRKEIVIAIDNMIRAYNPLLLPWLYSHVDHETGNTILHSASENVEITGGDALQLRDEIMWFEMVKKNVPRELWNHRNQEQKTAQQLFKEKHKPMLDNCNKQLMVMGKITCSSLVGILVFASSLSIPEKDQNTFHLLFKIFLHTYVIGFVCAASSLVLFFALVITPYKQRDFRRAVPTMYFFACLSFAMALLAFLTSFGCNVFMRIYGGWRREAKVPLILELTVFPAFCIIVLLYSGARLGPSFYRPWMDY